MITVIFIGILVMLSGYYAKRHSRALVFAFVIIFAFLALRYNYGNDYISYSDGFDRLTQYNSASVWQYDFDIESWEAGWVALNVACQHIGFQGVIILWSLFYCVVFYYFIKRYVVAKYYWLALFLLVFMPMAMLIGLSMLRNMLAILVFIIAFKFLLKKGLKNSIIYLLLVYTATLFHKSAYVLLPLVILPYINVKIGKWSIIAILILNLSLFGFSTFFADKITMFIANSDIFSSYDAYTQSGNNRAVSIGLGYLVNMMFFSMALFLNSDEKDEANKMAVKMLIFYNLLIPIGVFVLALGRLGFYFIPFMIICYANMFAKINNLFVRSIVIVMLMIFTIYQFVMFMHDPIWTNAYLEYRTIFSANY